MRKNNTKTRGVMWHNLKVWPDEFGWTISGTKNFEWRKNDRDFQSGDYLVLEEWRPNGEGYTGRSCTRQIDYILSGKFGIPQGFIIMSTRPV